MGKKDWQRPLLRELARWVRKKFPPPFPVRCYVRPAKSVVDNERQELSGGFWPIGTDGGSGPVVRGIIVISDAARNSGELLDTFAEEWAHALTCPTYGFRRDEHTRAFKEKKFDIMHAREQTECRKRWGA